MSKRTPGAFLLILVAAFCGYSQEPASPAAQPTPTPTTTANSTYTFPDKSERFKRYVNSTVGPLRLARTAGSETVLKEGVKPGETVVTDGQLRLVPGSRISIKTGNTEKADS